jgi:hypothetical protein
LNENKIEKIVKLIPSISSKPAEELNALFFAKANLKRRDTLAVINLANPVLYQKAKRQKKGKKIN